MRDGEPLSLESVSAWEATAPIARQDTRLDDTRADVCIVGAGIAGMTTAYLLGRSGLKVVVLDDNAIAGGQTQRTTAHLTCAVDDRFYEIERLHGERGARLAAESHAAAISRIELIAREEGIDCDFERVDGYLFLGPKQPAQLLERELGAARRAGLADVELLTRVPIAGVELGPCLRFPQQAQFHPLKYLAGLAQAITRDGGRIHTGTHVTSIEGGVPARVQTEGGAVVTASHVVVTTNTPINDRVVLHTRQAPSMTYVVGLTVARDALPHVLCWDMLDPYHYIRVQPLPPAAGAPPLDLLMVGGEDHKTGQASDQERRWGTLEEWARGHFPMAQELRFRWSGQVMETLDGLAFIGRNPLDKDNVYIATGDSGMGLTHGTIAGIVINDLIHGRDNPWAALYDPSRKTLRAAHTFASENLNVVRQYAEWLAASEAAASARSIRRGHGQRPGQLEPAPARRAEGLKLSPRRDSPRAPCNDRRRISALARR